MGIDTEVYVVSHINVLKSSMHLIEFLSKLFEGVKMSGFSYSNLVLNNIILAEYEWFKIIEIFGTLFFNHNKVYMAGNCQCVVYSAGYETIYKQHP